MMLRFLILLHLLIISWFARANAGVPQPGLETKFLGSWKVVNPNAGVEAMQAQLLPNNKFVWFDTTALGDSALRLEPPGFCPLSFEHNYNDCFAHAVEFDIATSKVRPLELRSDPWCSSGVLAPSGNVVITGGFNKGIRSVRTFPPCPTPINCQNFKEVIDVLGENRWYSSNAVLEDATYIVVGGRDSFSYEILPPDTLQFPVRLIPFPFLKETTDRPNGALVENNLYPFVYLLTDGNTLLFANNRSVVFEPKTGKILRELPPLPGGARNYPATGTAALLPIDLTIDPSGLVGVEMVVCGGNTHQAFLLVEGLPQGKRQYLPALQDCGRILTTKPGAQWEIDQMPSRRVLADMINLPNGELIIIGGAQNGTAAWWNAEVPNLTPVLYTPDRPLGHRFKTLAPTTIPRMYHAIHALMPDGKIMAAGSNPHSRYVFQSNYITELRVETFDPPYLDPSLAQYRPEILDDGTDKKWKYSQQYRIKFKLQQPLVDNSSLKMTLYSPPFVSHGFSMNQRLIYLKVVDVKMDVVTVIAPPSGKIAPPGYYLLFAVNSGIPSKGVWINV